MMKGYRPKPALRPTEKTPQEVPSYESYHQVTMLILRQDVPEFEPGLLASTLLLALERGGNGMDGETRAAILRVAACLQKRLIEEHSSDLQARAIIKKVKAAR